MTSSPSSRARLLALIVLMLVLFAVQACVSTVLHLQARLLGPGLRAPVSTASPTP
jgi:hypothetical protein